MIAPRMCAGHDVSCPYETTLWAAANRTSAMSITARQNSQTPDQPRRRHAYAPRNEPAGPACEIADHVEHVEAAAGIGSEAVDARLIGDVAGLDAHVHQKHADDQASQSFSRSPQDDVGREDCQQRGADGESRAVLIGEAPDERCACGSGRAHRPKRPAAWLP